MEWVDIKTPPELHGYGCKNTLLCRGMRIDKMIRAFYEGGQWFYSDGEKSGYQIPKEILDKCTHWLRIELPKTNYCE